MAPKLPLKEMHKKTKSDLVKDIKSQERQIKHIEKKHKRFQGARSFNYVLSLISVMGFIGIIVESFFYLDIGDYIKFSWMLIMGIGLFVEAKVFSFFREIREHGLEGENFHRLITSTVAFLAIVIAILSFPLFGFSSLLFMAIEGTIAIIAALYILMQTWIVR